MVTALQLPMPGPMQARNSPADRVPSHGTSAFASALAIDLVPVDGEGRSAPFGVRALLCPEPPTRFVGHGRPVLAPIAGRVLRVHDGEPDHSTHRGLPSIAYALGQGRRAREGWAALAGNHVLLAAEGSSRRVVALCHLQQGTLEVRVGEHVEAREPLGRCGNSGNSMEPHVHLQVMNGPDPRRARALPLHLAGGVPRTGDLVEGPSA